MNKEDYIAILVGYGFIFIVSMLAYLATIDKKRRKLKINRIRTFDINTIIVTTISIVAFFSAVDYFTAVTFLKINVFHNKLGFYMGSLVKFYEQRQIKIPDLFYNDPLLKGLMNNNFPDINKNYVQPGDVTSDDKIIRALRAGQKFNDYILERRINMLKEQSDKYEYKKKVWGPSEIGLRGFYPPEMFKDVLKYIESVLSKEQFYVFYSGLIHSREVYNSVWIKNDGKTFLSDIRLVIPSPISKINEYRNNNILSYNVAGNIINEVELLENKLIVKIPSLKVGDFIQVNITSRENKISDKEIYYSYKSEKIFEKNKMFVHALIIFILVIIGNIFFTGNRKRNGIIKEEDTVGIQKRMP